MALEHAESGDLIDVRPLGARLASTVSSALFKGEDLEVMRLVLRSGKEIPPHKVAGEVTIQCLEGVVEVTSGSVRRLEAGWMVFLRGDVVHSLRAIEEASVLVTIFLERRGDKLQGRGVAGLGQDDQVGKDGQPASG